MWILTLCTYCCGTLGTNLRTIIWKTTTWLLSQKIDGMNHTNGVLQLVAISCSEETGKEGKVGSLPSVQKKNQQKTGLQDWLIARSHLWITAMHRSRACGRSQRSKLCGWFLLEATWSRKGCWWRVLSYTTGSVTITGPDPARGLQRPGHLLEEWHNKLQAFQETTGVQWGKLPSTGDREPKQRSGITGCVADQCRRKNLSERPSLELACAAVIMPW